MKRALRMGVVWWFVGTMLMLSLAVVVAFQVVTLDISGFTVRAIVMTTGMAAVGLFVAVCQQELAKRCIARHLTWWLMVGALSSGMVGFAAATITFVLPTRGVVWLMFLAVPVLAALLTWALGRANADLWLWWGPVGPVYLVLGAQLLG